MTSATGVAVGGALVAPELARALGGEDFVGAATPLRILLAAAAIGFVNGLYGHALIARNRQLAALWLNVLALTLNVALNIALVPSYGIEAAAWTALGCPSSSCSPAPAARYSPPPRPPALALPPSPAPCPRPR